MKFRDLKIGQEFDWINDNKPGYNSFFLTCRKTGIRTYEDENKIKYHVGSINAEVFHVKSE